MTLSDLSSIGNLVSGLAVLVSLLYLSLQVRQTERNQRALMNQGVIDRGSEDVSFLAQPHITELESRVLAGEKEFTPAEIRQLRLIMRKIMIGGQDAYVQNKSGMTDLATFEDSLGVMKHYLSRPVYRAIWKSNRTSYATEWSGYVDQLIRETPLAQSIDAVAQFKSDLAEVLR